MKLSLLSTVAFGVATIANPIAEADPAAAAAGGSICDRYTTALLKDNTAENQKTLLKLLVNTAVIGNYSDINTGVKVPGILAPGTYGGEKVNLLPYFNGALASSNRGGKCGVSINFLDGGGAAPLMNNMAANSKNTNQFDLLTHLYKFFAALLGCSQFGNTVRRYDGFNGMYEVHKFMALDQNEVGWFIQNVGLSAASFGVSKADVSAVGSALMNAFGYRCLPPASIPSFEKPALQSICTECSCPKSTDCGDYGPVIEPKPAKYAHSGWCGSKDWHNSWQWCGKNHYGGGHYGGH